MIRMLKGALLMAVVVGVSDVSAQDVKTRVYQPSSKTAASTSQVRTREIVPLDPSPFVGEQAFAFSVMPMVEFPSREWDSVFFRFNLFVGAHRNVYWFDIGILGNITDNEMSGLGLACLFNDTGMAPSALHIAGVCNHSDWNFSGLQLAAGFCWTEGLFSGLQVALVNSSGRMNGVQVGGINIAEQGVGAQVGLVNASGRLEGLQVGLVNMNRDSSVPVLPLINFAY